MTRTDTQPAGGEPEQLGTLIAELQKNSRERLRITVDQYRGHEYVGIRIWFVGEDGQYRPSRSGVTLKPALLPQLMQALGRAARAIDPHGAN
ncbi:transcriptional coactivator p15/PC4 family protein [Burkholderia vietnamiensis]|uniref:transcriptional coactivator p15/PC4 family protein n=1 Tax=Burkholderia vietnamiensis TaxID=60552 RepID=UPI001590557F|nr:transcriptional coactivator p15/PC4 family protein [Burkholderia vietnamiensis]